MLLSTGYLRTVTFEEEAWITSAEVSVIQLLSISTKKISKTPRFEIFSDFFRLLSYKLVGEVTISWVVHYRAEARSFKQGTITFMRERLYALSHPMARGLSAKAMNVRDDMFRRQLCKEEEPELWEEMKEEGVLGIFSKAGKEVAEITFFR